MATPRLDAHQHFWSYRADEYPWIAPGSALQRDWLPGDLTPLLAKAELDGSIAVQARQSLAESRWLLDLAEQHAAIRGVVGWVDLRSPEVERDLANLAHSPKFAGVRHVVQDEPDDEFMLRPDFQRGMEALSSHGLTYDLLVYPKQLRAAIELVARFPEQPFVLDHMGKPPIRSGALTPWRELLVELAQAPNVSCKVSGLATEADHANWQPEQLRPYLDVAFKAFGVERLMFGSDWPVCLLAGSYERVVSVLKEYTRGLSSNEQEALFGGNAARFYSVGRRTRAPFADSG